MYVIYVSKWRYDVTLSCTTDNPTTKHSFKRMPRHLPKNFMRITMAITLALTLFASS